MIALDTSALIAVLQREEGYLSCAEVLEVGTDFIISAGTLAEALIVSRRKSISAEMTLLLSGLPMTVVPVTHEISLRVAEAYDRWGRGVHPAKLNFGDCFAYEVAKSHSCPLLFVGNDFSRTDVVSAIDG